MRRIAVVGAGAIGSIARAGHDVVTDLFERTDRAKAPAIGRLPPRGTIEA